MAKDEQVDFVAELQRSLTLAMSKGHVNTSSSGFSMVVEYIEYLSENNIQSLDDLVKVNRKG